MAAMYSRDLAHVHHTAFSGDAAAVARDLTARLREAGVTRGTVVEAGCGGGLVAKRLAAAGYRVRGFDVSPSMVRLARQQAPEATFGVASLVDVAFPACAAVVAVGEVVTYLPGGIRALGRVFARVHAALEPGGLLLFDFIETARRRTYAMRTFSGPGWTMAVSARVAARGRTLTRRIVIERRAPGRTRVSRAIHRVRVYPRRTIVAALEAAGFAVATARTFGRQRLLPGTVAVVARKSGRI
jgi:trans-aconitate methyltransferase